MRILANENFPRPAVIALRQAGHDVLWAAVDCPSRADLDLLTLAREQQRAIATLDKDFGELAFARGAANDWGVVLFRVGVDAAAVCSAAVQVFAEPADFRDKFVVVEPGRMRIRQV